jgi:transposase InsO family protein
MDRALVGAYNARLRELASAFPDGVPGHLRGGIKATFGVSDSKFRRDIRIIAATLDAHDSALVAAPPKRRKEAFDIQDPPVLQALAANAFPTRKAGWKWLRDELHMDVPGYPHYTRLLKQAHIQDKIAKLRRGLDKGRDTQTEILEEAEYPDQRWAIDTKWVSTCVTADRGGAPQWATQVTIIDDFSREKIVSLTFLGAEAAENVLCTLALAVRLTGGIAEEIRCDNGGENLSPPVRRFVLSMGSRLSRSNSYHKNENGKVERVQGTMELQMCRLLPLNDSSPRHITGQSYFGDGPYLTIGMVRKAAHAFWDSYSNTVHSAHGMTPKQRYTCVPSGLLPVEQSLYPLVAAAALPDPSSRKTKQMADTGVMISNVRYWDLALAGRVGHTFKLRYWPEHPSHVEVFETDGQWLCTAGIAKHTKAGARRANAARNADVDAEVSQLLANGEAIAQQRARSDAEPSRADAAAPGNRAGPDTPVPGPRRDGDLAGDDGSVADANVYALNTFAKPKPAKKAKKAKAGRAKPATGRGSQRGRTTDRAGSPRTDRAGNGGLGRASTEDLLGQ